MSALGVTPVRGETCHSIIDVGGWAALPLR